MSKFLKYILLVCGVVIFWITPSLIKGKSFDDSIDDLIYAIGFLVSLAFIGYLFYIFVIKKNP